MVAMRSMRHSCASCVHGGGRQNSKATKEARPREGEGTTLMHRMDSPDSATGRTNMAPRAQAAKAILYVRLRGRHVPKLFPPPVRPAPRRWPRGAQQVKEEVALLWVRLTVAQVSQRLLVGLDRL